MQWIVSLSLYLPRKLYQINIKIKFNYMVFTDITMTLFYFLSTCWHGVIPGLIRTFSHTKWYRVITMYHTNGQRIHVWLHERPSPGCSELFIARYRKQRRASNFLNLWSAVNYLNGLNYFRLQTLFYSITW